MKQFFMWAIALTLILTSCGKGTSFSVKGKFADKMVADSTVLLLQKINYETGDMTVLDTAIVKDGEFEFKGEAKEEPCFNVIVPQTPDGKTPSITFVREPGKIEVDIKDIEHITVSGTKINDQFQKMQTDVLALQQKAMQATSDEQKAGLIKQVVGAFFAYAKENMQNSTGEQIFSSIAFQLSSDQVKELLKNARPSFTEKGPVKMLQKSMEAKERMAKTNQYEDINLVDPNGQTVALSTYVGKSNYVLVDFWASWCQPCMQEMPNIVAAYSKFKSKGFEVVSISVDKDKEAWLGAVKQNNMSWIQLNDVDGNGSLIYGIQTIPYTLLIDRNGKILAQNLRGEALDAKLSELMP